jgi:hypothetical protein
MRLIFQYLLFPAKALAGQTGRLVRGLIRHLQNFTIPRQRIIDTSVNPLALGSNAMCCKNWQQYLPYHFFNLHYDDARSSRF